MQTRDQKYAVDIYKRVEKIEEKDRKSYGSMAHKLPVLIRTAGLAQALAFVEARGKPAQKRLLTDLAETVGKKDILLSVARSAHLSDYIHLTQQVMAALLWYKRFAQSVLGVNAGDDVTEENTSNG
jgi:CRISPR-associated protein Cmr5